MEEAVDVGTLMFGAEGLLGWPEDTKAVALLVLLHVLNRTEKAHTLGLLSLSTIETIRYAAGAKHNLLKAQRDETDGTLEGEHHTQPGNGK